MTRQRVNARRAIVEARARRKRHAPPEPIGAALDAGSDYLVIGRPISQAADPAAALQNILSELG